MKQVKLAFRYPLFGLFVALVGGILISNFCEISPSFFWFLFFFGVLFSISTLANRWFKSYSYRPVFGVAVTFLFFGLGGMLCHFNSELWLKNHYTHFKNKDSHYLFELEENPIEKSKSFKSIARVHFMGEPDSLLSISGRVLLYLKKDSLSSKLRTGDRILFNGTLSELKPPMNPMEFDYKNYLNLQSVYAQAYLSSKKWRLYKTATTFSIRRKAEELRQRLLNKIDGWNLGAQEKAISKALLLGYRYEIDRDLMSSYSSSGASHVLAVSGLHVGIIYLMTSYLLSFLNFFGRLSWLKPLSILVFLWFYALLTGFSPSVVRAVTMFSFVVVGKGFNRETSIYNTLLASATLLLIIKPNYLFEVGFQLSYTAVFFIVWLQSKLESLWTPRYWIVKKVWLISTVSIAAQIGTFPLGLYYFHQFPSLFLISNLLVIPIISVLMYLGILYFILFLIGFDFELLLKLYEGSMKLMNKGIVFIDSFSFAQIKEIHISRLELVLFYVFILSIFSWLLRGDRWKLQSALVIASALMFIQLREKYRLNGTSDCWVYSISKQTALGIVEGSEFYLLADSAFLKDKDKQLFHVSHHIWSKNITHLNQVSLDSSFRAGYSIYTNKLLQFNNDWVWIYSQDIKPTPKARFWVVNEYNQYPYEKAQNLPSIVILCGRISKAQEEAWQQWSKNNNIQIVNVLEDGAYKLISS